MTGTRTSLGRNLTALLSPKANSFLTEGEEVIISVELLIEQLQPGKYQPRQEIEEDALAELAASIKRQGLLQPLIVRKLSEHHYEIIAGERRWRACQLLGFNKIPVIIRQVDDEAAMAIALVENLQREDLSALDQAQAMQRLGNEFSLTQQQIADLLGKSRASISNHLRLLNLSTEVKQYLEQGNLDMGHARALLTLDELQQAQAARIIVNKKLSVRETEALVTRIKNGKPENLNQAELSPLLKEQAQTLAGHLNTKVNIRPGKTGKGTLVIHYNNIQILQAMIRQIICTT